MRKKVITSKLNSKGVVPKELFELKKTKEVAVVISTSMSLKKPLSDIKKFLENVGSVYNIETNTLEEWLSVFIEWENYFRENVEIYDTLRIVAESQKAYYWGKAILHSSGQISEKKETARLSVSYQKANDVFIQANASFKMLSLKANNCERGYKLVSRILAKRINIREQ